MPVREVLQMVQGFLFVTSSHVVAAAAAAAAAGMYNFQSE